MSNKRIAGVFVAFLIAIAGVFVASTPTSAANDGLNVRAAVMALADISVESAPQLAGPRTYMVPIEQCRLIDTRLWSDRNDWSLDYFSASGDITGKVAIVTTNGCSDILNNGHGRANALAINVTVVNNTWRPGWVNVWDGSKPSVGSIMNPRTKGPLANHALVQLGTPSSIFTPSARWRQIKVATNIGKIGDDVEIIIDVHGVYVEV